MFVNDFDEFGLKAVDGTSEAEVIPGDTFEVFDEDKLTELNSSFNSDDFYAKQIDSDYGNYLEQRQKAYETGDYDSVTQWDDYYTSLKNARDFYETSSVCTFDGTCDDPSQNIFENTEAEWRYDEQIYNQELLKSLRRTFGSYDRRTGNAYTDQDLIDIWMTDQAHNATNLTKFGIEAASLMNATEQQKKDLALQLLTYDKIKATGEGSRDGWKQTFDVATGLLTDPMTYGSFALFGVGLIGKESAKAATKQGIKETIKKFLIKPTVSGALLGAEYAGFDNLARQSIRIEGGLQDGMNWGEFGTFTTVGSVLGGSLGYLLSGLHNKFNDLANRYMVKNNLTNKDFLKELRENVTDEKSLHKWLKNLGWTRREAKEEIAHLNKEGLEYNAVKGVWQNARGQEYKPTLEVKGTEEAQFGKEVTERISTAKQKASEKVLDEEYIDVQNVDLPISFSRLGQRAFDWFDNVMGATAVRTLYGGDSVLVRSGLRKEATAISDAMTAIDLNVARMSNTLKDMVAKNERAIGDINQLIRNRNPQNKEQKDFLKELDKLKDSQMRMAYKNKVISPEEYQAFLKDKAYIPRVWNSQHLLTPKGAEEFSVFMNKLWKTDAKGARHIIENLTGKKEEADLVINSRFAPSKVQEMFRNKADKEIDVHRSSHLEHERKIKLPPEYEHMLDQFMAKPIDRWSKFFEDVVKRNEFAKRFGGKDQYIHKRIKDLENQGRHRAAEHLKEYYFTTMGDARYSKTVSSKMNNPRLMRGISKINAFQNLKLGLAAIPNATQSFVNGTTKLIKSHGLIKAPFKAISGIVRALVKTKRDLEIINRAGVLGETDLARIATENMPHSRIIENEFRGPLKYLNEPTKFLRAVGFLGVEEMNRRAASIMAHGHVASIHSTLRQLILKGTGDTRKAKSLEKEIKELGVSNPRGEELTPRDYAVSGHIFNKQVNFSGESYTLPSHWQTPWFKLFTKFKSFMFYQARFLKRQVSDELFINHNPKPLIAYLAAGGLAGNAAELARSLATGKDIEENRNALELLIAGIGNAGGAGLWWDTMSQALDRGPSALSSILGPTVSDVMYTTEDIGDVDLNSIIKRMLPNVPGKHQLMDSFKY